MRTRRPCWLRLQRLPLADSKGELLRRLRIKLAKCCTLQPQQERLHRQPASVTAKVPTARQHAVTRHDDRDGIVVVCLPHSARAFRVTNRAGNLAIRSRLSIRNLQQLLPAALAKLRSPQIKLEIEIATLASKYSSS